MSVTDIALCLLFGNLVYLLGIKIPDLFRVCLNTVFGVK